MKRTTTLIIIFLSLLSVFVYASIDFSSFSDGITTYSDYIECINYISGTLTGLERSYAARIIAHDMYVKKIKQCEFVRDHEHLGTDYSGEFKIDCDELFREGPPDNVGEEVNDDDYASAFEALRLCKEMYHEGQSVVIPI